MKRTASLFAALYVIFAGIVNAVEPPKKPILRIETVMHTAMVRRIGVDGANRFLVTGSADKTARLWDLQGVRNGAGTQALLSTFRIPAGGGNEGKIYSVAISPDGNTIACGGWTGYEWDGSHSIYLFDRASGQLVHRVAGISNVIDHLAFSKDGAYLAAGLGEYNGIRVYATNGWQERFADKSYESDSHSVDFSADGRMLTTSWDGYLRLYDNGFRLIAKQKAPGGIQPYAARFSPDGAKIAVGFVNSAAVNVLSARDLSLLYSPNTDFAKTGALHAVSWSADGSSLYAGGTYSVGGGFPLIKWGNGGRGEPETIQAAGDTVLDIVPLNDGLAFGSADPALGIVNGNGQGQAVTPAIADYRDNQKNFKISYDGSVVGFGYKREGKSTAVFSVIDGRLEVGGDQKNLSAPLFSTDGINVTGWENTASPKLNGDLLKLANYEISRSLAVKPDGAGLLLGGDWYLRLFDASGNVLWKTATSGSAWAVNIAGNGKVAMAAISDGTIRWYRMADGKELVAFFPHADQKRWVTWSISGYYAASAGGEDLIGWHINNGAFAAADFFSASRFRSAYYRPDVVEKMFDVFDEPEAVLLANAESGRKQQAAAIQNMLPPVVSIVTPTDGAAVSAGEVLVKFTIRVPSGEPVTGYKAYVDGRAAGDGERGVKVVQKDEAGVYSLLVPVPEQDCVVSVIAENRFAASEPASVRIRWAGAHKPKDEEFVQKPRLYVLAVGVSDYDNKDLQLGLAAKDARDFAAALAGQKGGLYRDVVVKTLTDKQATKDNVLEGLEWLEHETTAKDVAMIFMAGHGMNNANGVYYFLPVNADPDSLKRTGVVFSDVKNTLSALAGKAVLFIDTCHSGNVMGTRRGVADTTAVVNELASAENGVMVFTSSTGRQYSLEDPAWGNGAFTKALVEGITGKADLMGKGKITLNMLDAYVADRVKELTKGKQTPTSAKPSTVPDYPVALVLRGGKR